MMPDPEAEIVTSPPSPPEQPQSLPEPSMDGDATITDRVQRSREAIPVGDRGITPQTYAQWIDVAKDICRAHLLLPQHLHGKAPVVAGLLEIAARFKLSPFMLAGQTYVPPGSNRLAFQAQAFGAILYASGMLIGRLRFEYHGEGDDLTCTVSGRFKDDPDTTYSATTPTLRQLHPGTTQKDGKVFVRGSPLWDRDPEQQMAYFAERRWIRRHAPDVCLGMFTPEEIEQLDQYRAERDGAITLTADRLGQLNTGEGWGDGAHLDTDLAAIAPELPVEPEPEPPKPQRKAAQGRKLVASPKAAPPAKTRPGRPGRPPRGRSLTRAVVKAAADRAKRPSTPARAPTPRWLEYVTTTENWIKGLTAEQAPDAEPRWERERELRDRLQVPIGERSRLHAILERKLKQLK